MKLSNIGAALCIAAAAIGVSSHAGEHRNGPNDDHRNASQMQVIAVSDKAGEPGHGWQYFSDASRGRAVVISPSGDYYYSRGEGLRLVFKGSRSF